MGCRRTIADLIGLMLRDKVDIATGDFNQAGYSLGECVKHAVAHYHQGNTHARAMFTIPEPNEEIRTVFSTGLYFPIKRLPGQWLLAQLDPEDMHR